jgi:transketolase
MKVTEKELPAFCARLRNELIDVLYDRQTGHPGGSLSCCEILAALYFHTMNIDPGNPRMENRDRLVLSKGHAAPMLYLCLAYRGFFPPEEIKTLRRLDSNLQGHPCAHKTPGVELSTGPLGLGLSAAVGMAEAAKLGGRDYNVFVVLGDGELQEGIVWEAAMTANKYRTSNIIAILDHNRVQLDGTNDEIMPMGDIAAKFGSFGWHVLSVDGHDTDALTAVYRQAIDYKDGPVIIIAETVKGKGVSFMEGKSAWHGRPISEREYAEAKKELERGIG